MAGPLQWRDHLYHEGKRVSECTREICGKCNELNALGFEVSDDLWSRVWNAHLHVDPKIPGSPLKCALAAVPEQKPTCFRCFVVQAEGREIEWDYQEIKFHPISNKTFLRLELKHYLEEKHDR